MKEKRSHFFHTMQIYICVLRRRLNISKTIPNEINFLVSQIYLVKKILLISQPWSAHRLNRKREICCIIAWCFMRRKTGFPEDIIVIAQRDFAGIVRVDRLSDESRARTERSGGGRAPVGGAKPFSRRRGSLLTDKQTGSREGEEHSEFVLKRPTVCFGRRRGIRSGDLGLFLSFLFAVYLLFFFFLLHIRNYLRMFSLFHPASCKRIY